MVEVDRSVHVGGSVQGSSINTGDIVASTVNTSATDNHHNSIQTITISPEFLTKMPLEYATSLDKFIQQLNHEMRTENLSAANTAELQNKINELAKETADVKPGQPISYSKKNSIGANLLGLAKSVVKLSPKIAQAVIPLTPLAPFSGLIGEAFEKIISDALKETT